MIPSQQKKVQQLGMSLGKARNRLVRSFIFHLAQKLGLDKCARCGGQLTEDDYSLDHAKDWFGTDPALYFDPANVNLSHRKCNTDSRRSKGGNPNPVQSWRS
jgi:hypothetical protein